MTTATPSIRSYTLCSGLPIALAIGAFAVMTPRAHAAELDKIVMSGPVVKAVGYDKATNLPVREVTVVAQVLPDPETLTTESGIALLNDNVREAARKVCAAAEPLQPNDDACYRKAVESAKPQVAALIEHAKNAANG